MRRPASLVLVWAVLAASAAGAQDPAGTPADPTVYAVSYVETKAASRTDATAALKAYRDASRGRDGNLRIDLFEQAGRPGHFAIVEAWRDAPGFDGNAAARKALLERLEPLRISGYDQRLYKTLSVVASPAGASPDAVSIVTHVDVSPNPRVAVMLRELAEAGRMESGNVRFDVYQHAMRANHFTVVETWQSRAALDAHVAAAGTRRYRDELQPLTGSPLDERAYAAVP